MTTNPQHVYVVREIRDGVHRRTHGHFASLQGAFRYCETEERKKPLIDSVRFELFAAPGGKQWLIHQYYGPEDDFPETSDFVISEHEVIPDEGATPPPPDRAAVLPAVGIFATLVRQRADHTEAALARMRDRLEVTHVRVRRLHAPGENGKCQHCHHISPCPTVQALHDDTRRMADEEQHPETQTEARPAETEWRVEGQWPDGTWREWSAAYTDRDAAQEGYETTVQEVTHPIPLRLVRETKTYILEAEHAPAVVPQPGKEG